MKKLIFTTESSYKKKKKSKSMSQNKEEMKTLIEKEIQKYTQNNASAKQYFASMKEISSWLSSLESK